MASQYDITSMASLKKKASNSGLKKALTSAMKGTKAGEFFGDSNWNGSSGKMWTIKVSEDNLKMIEKNVDEKIKGKNLDTVLADYKVRFQRSGLTTAPGKKADGKTTAMQEEASMWIIKRAVNDNKKYSKWQDITKDGKYRELVELYPDIDDVWLQGLWAQNKKMYQEYASSHFSEWSRSGGFMDFITDLVRAEFGITRKDTWNPADIWMVNGESKREQELKKACEGNNPQIQELNEVMKKLFKSKKVVGVSLKKISGKEAKWELVNVEDVMFEGNDFNFEVDKIRMTLSEKEGTDGQFGTQDTVIFLEDVGGSFKFKFQIKNSAGGKIDNQKVEGTVIGASAARAGKAPQEFLRPLYKEYGMKYENRHQQYPYTPDDFLKEFDTHYRRFKFIYPKIDCGIKNTKIAFKNAFLRSWTNKIDSRAGIPTGKLMQIHFVYDIYKLTKKKREDLLTDLVFLAQKKGKRFGPFGKLY
jgi:hypothetical protein